MPQMINEYAKTLCPTLNKHKHGSLMHAWNLSNYQSSLSSLTQHINNSLTKKSIECEAYWDILVDDLEDAALWWNPADTIPC